MELIEHLDTAKQMLTALSVVDDAQRSAIVLLLNVQMTRQQLTDARIRLKGLRLLDAEESDKEKIDKVLLGAMTKLPVVEAPQKDESQKDESPEDESEGVPMVPESYPPRADETLTEREIDFRLDFWGWDEDMEKDKTNTPIDTSTNTSLFDVLIAVARRHDDAKKLSLAFWEDLANKLEKYVNM